MFSEAEQRERKFLEYRAPDTLIVHDILRNEGEHHLGRSANDLIFSGIAGGTSMVLSVIAMAALEAHLPKSAWTPLVSSIGFTLGFIVVILGHMGLITESTVNVVLPWMEKKHIGFAKVLRVWLLVLIPNLIATLLLTLLLQRTTILSPELHQAAIELGKKAASPDTLSLFGKALLAGWMVALAVWTSPTAKTSTIFTVGLLTYFISLLELAHIISGTSEVAFATFAGELGIGDLLRFIVITTLGNILGGVLMVAAINHMQVRDELKHDPIQSSG